jgi:hypothetical protein
MGVLGRKDREKGLGLGVKFEAFLDVIDDVAGKEDGVILVARPDVEILPFLAFFVGVGVKYGLC